LRAYEPRTRDYLDSVKVREADVGEAFQMYFQMRRCGQALVIDRYMLGDFLFRDSSWPLIVLSLGIAKPRLRIISMTQLHVREISFVKAGP
jgi:hypothetical protein